MNIRHSLKSLLTAATVLGALVAGPAAAVAAPAGAAAQSVASAAPTAEKGARSAPSGTVPVYVWASQVNVRFDAAWPECMVYPSRITCAPIVDTVSRETVYAYCQWPGETIQDAGYSNRWWSYVRTSKGKDGYINNIYLRGGEKIAGVPDCSWVS
ncbi:hypothetical protein [Streptomyces tsukubensis]|uniref:hypothetical protein n=1 Tax=Streptomyces tsukubensis TaxID=83656 RepID=UPI00345030B7